MYPVALSNTEILLNHLVKEATELRLNTENFNRGGGFTLNLAWYPGTNFLSNQKAGPGREDR
jgi:hypothetical protein